MWSAEWTLGSWNEKLAVMAMTTYHEATVTAGLHQHCHQQHGQRWSSPCRTSSRALLFSRHRCPATLFFQLPRHGFPVARADSQEGRRPGDNESKEVLEAFFLGKALAEAVTERLGTVVGEFLSDVGRWQAEQQKQVRDFQEEVQDRAKKARAKALQEARTLQQKDVTSVSQNGASSGTGGDNNAQIGVPLKRPVDPAQDSTPL